MNKTPASCCLGVDTMSEIDLSDINEACKQAAQYLKKGHTSFDSWCREPFNLIYKTISDSGIKGFYYNGSLYIISRYSGSHGRGGMDQGTPPIAIPTLTKVVTVGDCMSQNKPFSERLTMIQETQKVTIKQWV